MSFLRDYLLYCRGNESPDSFHVWGAYVALSAAIGRKVWLPFGKGEVFPNIYVMYVGGAGNGKSAAMRNVRKILKALDDVPLSVSVETVEGMLRFIGGTPATDGKEAVAYPYKVPTKWPDGVVRDTHPMTIIANEYIDFISKNPEGWTNLLVNIYDEDNYGYRTKNQGEDFILGPYFVLLGALTTEISTDLHKTKILSTGLARRVIFQWGQRKFHEPCAIPEDTPEQREAFTRCLAHLKHLRSLCGEITWDADVKHWWTKWYNVHNRQVLLQPITTQGWFASKPDQVLKLGILTALSEAPDARRLEIPHLIMALRFLEEMEPDLPKVFGGAGRNELAGVALKMVEYLEPFGHPVPMSLMQNNFFSMCKPPNEFNDCLNHLISTKKIKRGILRHEGQQTDMIGITSQFDKYATGAGQPAVGDAGTASPVSEALPSWHSAVPPVAGP